MIASDADFTKTECVEQHSSTIGAGGTLLLGGVNRLTAGLLCDARAAQSRPGSTTALF